MLGLVAQLSSPSSQTVWQHTMGLLRSEYRGRGSFFYKAHGRPRLAASYKKRSIPCEIQYFGILQLDESEYSCVLLLVVCGLHQTVNGVLLQSDRNPNKAAI